MKNSLTTDQVIDNAIRKASEHLSSVKRRGNFQLTAFDHSLNVYKSLVHFYEDNECYETKVVAAVLHDILEDSNCTIQELIDIGVSDSAIRVIKLLTKTEGQNYDDYLKAIKNNPIATKIKIADMLNNLSDNPTKNQIKKYLSGLNYLMIG